MENFWSLLKRSLKETYVSVEPFHLFCYVDLGPTPTPPRPAHALSLTPRRSRHPPPPRPPPAGVCSFMNAGSISSPSPGPSGSWNSEFLITGGWLAAIFSRTRPGRPNQLSER